MAGYDYGNYNLAHHFGLTEELLQCGLTEEYLKKVRVNCLNPR